MRKNILIDSEICFSLLAQQSDNKRDLYYQPNFSSMLSHIRPHIFRNASRIGRRQFVGLEDDVNKNNSDKSFEKSIVIRQPREKIFDVVLDMDSYEKFLPFCTKSKISDIKDDTAKGMLEIKLPVGFHTVIHSDVTFERPNKIVSLTESETFEFLESTWTFSQKSDSEPDFTLVKYHIKYKTSLKGFKLELIDKCFEFVPDMILKSFLVRGSNKL